MSVSTDNPIELQQNARSAPVVVDRVKAAGDTDGATEQTVQKMCEYIRWGAADPRVQAAAAYARKYFAMGRSDQAMLAWAVFWYVKHCVKFRNDEATLFRLGEKDQQDLLIAPAVLVRMAKPSEDCDGFTMLSCAMLCYLGVPVLIVTVAVDPSDPERWSHVFPIAVPDRRIMPVDASNGVGPGWMVPREHISRFQAWNLDGTKSDLSLSRFRGLHGYVQVAPRYRRRGMGQDETAVFDNPFPPTVDASTSGSFGQPIDFGSGSGSGFNWSGLINNIVSTAGSVAKVAVLPQGASMYPNGAVVQGSLFQGGSGASLLPLIAVGGLGLLAISALSSKNK